MAKKNNTLKYVGIAAAVYAGFYLLKNQQKQLKGIAGRSNRSIANDIEEHLINTASSYDNFRDIVNELNINIPKTWWKYGMAYNWNFDNRKKPYLQGIYFYPNNKKIEINTGTALKHIIFPE